MAKIPTEVEAEATFPVVGCQYPEHLDNVAYMLNQDTDTLADELYIYEDTVEVNGKKTKGNAVGCLLKEGDAPLRVGWVPVAYEEDVEEWFRFLKQFEDEEACEFKASVDNVRWYDEENEVLKSFDITFTVKGVVND